ncbi:hypothetical protein BDA99DRAFT_523707 [Phascolomyces articulosus]|uniref:Uncharacterized protein n=1 Tax=Phascolomyces articulosus TaxID=60185 RepID=A0AAD5JQQ5_9FUNG|nr:hypothetical protein BDA99DRAFT_523707 [Phascolomyces articulosus]
MSPTLAITTSSTHIHHNDTAPSWVKELEGPSRNNLLKQTSCPSLIVTTHWSPTTPPHPSLTPTNDPSSIGGYTPTTTTTTNTTSTGYSLNNHNPPYPSSHENRITRGDGGHRGKEEIPSMMDQLSCRTFSAAAFVDHRTNYPIYPLSSGSEPITTTTKTTTTTTNHPSHRSDIRASTSPTSSNTSLKMDHFPL